MLLINIEFEAQSGRRLGQFCKRKWRNEDITSNPGFATH